MNNCTTTPRTTGHMAAELRDASGNTRTLAVPPGLTYDEAVAWIAPWLGATETLAQFVTFTAK